MPSHARSAWTRLGELLTRCRIELDSRYRNRRLFTAERAVEYRIVNDIELGRRDNYEPATLAALEVAYRLAPGAIGRFLGGGELEAEEASPPPARPPVAAPAADALLMDPALEAAVRRPLAAILAAMEEHGGAPAGLTLFPLSPPDARAWDELVGLGRRRGWSDYRIAQSMAVFFADDAQAGQRRKGNPAAAG